MGKKYVEALKLIEADKFYAPKEAVELVKKTATAKFDSTVEVAFRLGVNPKYPDQQVRGAMVLPHGTGKTKTVMVFAKGPKVAEAEAAGADFVGGEEYVAKIQGGWMDFDVCIATPDMMGLVGRLGKILGPRGLMPNPKVGTVTMDVTRAVTESKAGKIEYRTDKAGNVQAPIGKVSFTNPSTSLPIPLITVLIRGIRLLATVTTLSTKLPIKSLKLALSSAIPVSKLLQAALAIPIDPLIVVAASFAVVPVIPISVCTT